MVAVNELFPHGASAADPDWAELKNLTGAAIDLSGFQVRDKALANLFALPVGTAIEADGYLVLYCDDAAADGVPGGIHVPWKLSGKKGDEFHLLDPTGKPVDATTFGVDLASDRSWGRLPDGTGMFLRTTPTKGASNL